MLGDQRIRQLLPLTVFQLISDRLTIYQNTSFVEIS